MICNKTILTVVLMALSIAPVIGQDDDDTSFDGLVKIKNGPFKLSWIDPDVDFKQYDKVLPVDAVFQFRAVKKSSSSSIRRSNQREFYISDKDREKLIDTVSEIFQQELAKSTHFAIVDEPGPDTLVLRGGLLDIVSQVPPDLLGRGEIYLSSVGQATLVLELVDSLSGEVVYRGAERRAAQRPGGQAMLANTVTSWSEVRRWARRWATRLREGLDAIHE